MFNFRLAMTTMALFALAPTCATATTPTDAVVRVEITAVRNVKGDVGCLLFNTPDGYPETHAKALRDIHVPIAGDRAVCEFKDLVPGTYAVIVFHDENLNSKLDKNFLGIPQEGYVGSNNVRPLMSAPEFKDASFAVPTGPATVIKTLMRY
jgi:uncharacterized protein (DUF2141 family)